MVCKFCNAELDENVSVCPVCGKELVEAVTEAVPSEEITEETVENVTEPAVEDATETVNEESVLSKKKLSKKQIIIAIIGGVILLAVLVGAVLYGLGVNILPRENNLYYKDSYTAKSSTVEKNSGVVIATLGDQTLTNGMLQAFYWTSVSDFFYNYNYGSMLDISLGIPFEEQILDNETGMTVQHMFLENALMVWRRYATLMQMSKEAGFTLTSELQTYLDSLETQIQEAASESGYKDVNTFISEVIAPSCSYEQYFEYYKVVFTALAYYDTLYESMMPTQQELEDYYKEHETELKQSGHDKASGNYYDVRHILITPEGGTQDELGNTTYTEAEWEACRVAAQNLLDTYLAGEKTEDAFAALAMEESKDPGSNEEGGLYSQLTKTTQFVEEFKNWYLDESRKVGDTGLVKTSYGYHIMYFSGSIPIWEHETKLAVLTERTNKLLGDAEVRWPIETDFKKIYLASF